MLLLLLSKLFGMEYYEMYGFVLVSDCTIHFILCLKYRASEEKNM